MLIHWHVSVPPYKKNFIRSKNLKVKFLKQFKAHYHQLFKFSYKLFLA